MATTKHKQVKKVHHRRHHKSAAKNSDLKQATHRGRAPVKDPRSAQPGFTGVPVSVATLTPGQGPSMSSTPVPSGRGKTSNRSAASVQKIQQGASGAASSLAYGRAVSSRRGRGKRKSSNGRG